MSFWNRLTTWKSKSVEVSQHRRTQRTCHFEAMEPRRMLDADPLFVGSVFIEDDSGADAAGDQFYIAFQGGSATTELTRVVIDTNQDGDVTHLSEPDVYFDIDGTNQNGNGFGSGGAHGFVLSSRSVGVTLDEISVRVEDGGTRLVLDLQHFVAGDVLVFSVDVDQYFANKHDDQITSGIEFAGSQMSVEFSDAHWNITPTSLSEQGVFRYSYDFGSDALLDSGQLSSLPSEAYRIAEHDFQSIENRTAGAMSQFSVAPKPISISGTVWHDENADLLQDATESGIEGVTVRLQKQDESGEYVDVLSSSGAAIVATTNADGFYVFGTELGLLPGTYRVIEVQPDDYEISVGEVVGSVGGSPVGAINTASGNAISEIVIPLGDMHGVDFDFAEARAASICGFVYHDQNQNGRLDEGEDGIGGVEMMLTSLSTGWVSVPTYAVTASDGSYCFEGLSPGEYQITEVSQPQGFVDGLDVAGTVSGVSVGQAVNPGDAIVGVRLGSGASGIAYNFGEFKYSSISGWVYHDLANNGEREGSDPAIAGVELHLFNDQGSRVATTTTDADGRYRFGNLLAGSYRVVEVQPEDFIDGKDQVGTVDGVSRGGLANSGDEISGIQLVGGEQGVEYNFGEIQYASISGQVIADLDGDCVLDPESGDQPLSGVRVDLLDGDGQFIRSTWTDEGGNYTFGELLPGTYSVLEHQPLGYYQGSQHVGENHATLSPGTGRVLAENHLGAIEVQSGDRLVDYSFCELPGGTISGFVFQDGGIISRPSGDIPSPYELLSVRDGQRTADDKPIEGVVLELRNGITGEPILGDSLQEGGWSGGPIRTVTDANGYYEFKGLAAGNYAVFEIQPDGYLDHVDTPGSALGVAVNPTNPNPLLLSTLATGVNPNNDAILRIALGVGQTSVQNNFSEVKLGTTWFFIPPVVSPELPPVVRAATTMPLASPYTFAGAQTITTFQIQQGTAGGAIDYSWHLSVLDGGVTRGQYDPTQFGDDRFQSARHMNRERWLSMAMQEGQWIVSESDSEESPVFSVKMIYGVDGGIPLTGDFNGDGVDEIAIFKEGEWFIDLNGNGRWDQDDLWAELGTAEDRPVVGDWDGDGKDDIGIFGPRWPKDEVAIAREPGLPDPANLHRSEPKNVPPTEEQAPVGTRSVKVSIEGATREDLIDHVFAYGQPQDQPIAGDWNGDGIRTVGTFRDGRWVLDSDADGRQESSDAVVRFGQAGDQPVVGDWNGDGVEQIGVYRNGTWILDTNGNQELDATDRVFEMGVGTDVPVVGDFDGDGTDEAAVYRRGMREAG